MKYKELMVGDWAILNGNPLKIQAIDSRDAEIVAEDGIFCTEESRWAYTADKVEGIPLTPEILKKNGWYSGPILDKKLDAPWLYKEDKITLVLSFPNKQFPGLLIISDERKIRSMPDFVWNDTLYIHELQHALRLCKLDELADNFKV